MPKYNYYQIWERELEEPSVEFIGYITHWDSYETLCEDQDGNTHYLLCPRLMEESDCFVAFNCEAWWNGKGCAGVIESMRVSGWLADDTLIPLILLPPVEIEDQHTVQNYDA